jgi:hypothetical protein
MGKYKSKIKSKSKPKSIFDDINYQIDCVKSVINSIIRQIENTGSYELRDYREWCNEAYVQCFEHKIENKILNFYKNSDYNISFNKNYCGELDSFVDYIVEKN